MKKLILAGLLLISMQGFAGWKMIKGDGHLASEQRNIQGFTALEAGSGFIIEISYGTCNSITVEADENLLPDIETNLHDGTLSIKAKNLISFHSEHPITIKVCMTRITRLGLSGSGSITGEGDFRNEGKTELAMSGSGSIQLKFSKFNSLDVSASGSGSIILAGRLDQNIRIRESGSGLIDCTEVGTDTVSASLSGSGIIKVSVPQTITANISGSGQIYYSGNPDIIRKISGSGELRRI